MVQKLVEVFEGCRGEELPAVNRAQALFVAAASFLLCALAVAMPYL